MAAKDGKSTAYRLRMPRDGSKKYHLMRFKQRFDLSLLAKPTLGRLEVESEPFETQPTHGEGSEYGKKRREEARMRKRGYDARTLSAEDQPWELREGKKDGKRYHGRKEGGVNTSSSYFMLCHCSDGAFEAHPVDSWYDFAPVIKHTTFTAEEAEEKYLLKNKTLNYFSLKLSKKLQSQADEDGGSSHSRLLITDQERAQWSDESDKEELPDPTTRAKGKQPSKRKKAKKNKLAGSTESGSEGGDTTDDGEMESCEVDYISDSSESAGSDNGATDKQMEDFKQRTRDVSGEEDSTSSEEEAELTEEGRELHALIKKQQRPPMEGSSDEHEDDPDALTRSGSEPTAAKAGTKRALEESGQPNSLQPDSKRAHSAESPSAIAQHEVLHYLQRKPIYTKELVRKFCKKKPGMTKAQVLQSLERIISTLSVEKTERDGKAYLCLKS